ncbi:MAG: hypothetical protein EPO68_12395 [Planctomycetota bacterium]|nr:MAG: hypothetical protein EPO68_12395 [Planctomycetota bacterium]
MAPTRDELVGRYELVSWQSSLPPQFDRIRAPGFECFVALHADGRFDAVNVLGHGSTSDAHDALVSATGNWSVQEVATLGNASGSEIRPIWGVRFSSDPQVLDASCMRDLLDDAPPRRLAFVFGDPDNGEGMILRRRP